jgi:hypothetical protein
VIYVIYVIFAIYVIAQKCDRNAASGELARETKSARLLRVHAPAGYCLNCDLLD